MKKPNKRLGALALSATLALGCAAPAFADPYGTDVDGASVETKKQGESVATDVKVATIVTNINVAVPLNVTIVADAASNQVLAPSAGLKHYAGGAYDGSATTGYRIENYSPFPVKIADIATLDTSAGGWALVSTDVLGQEAAAGSIGDLNLTLKPANAGSTITGGTMISNDEGNKNPDAETTGINLADVKVAAEGDKSGTDPKWTIDRKVSDDEPAIMGLLLSGANSILKNVNEGSILMGSADAPVDSDPVAADNAFKIFYVVGATSLASAGA